MATEEQKLTVLGALDEQGRRLGYDQRPEVQRHPVLGCLGLLSPEQSQRMGYHLDQMGDDERERAYAALLDLESKDNVPVGVTLVGAGLRPDEDLDPERYPYLYTQIIRHVPRSPS